MEDASDPGIPEDGHALQGDLEPSPDAIEMRFEEFVLGLPRHTVVPDGVGIFLLVDADKARELFHAAIAAEGSHVPDDGKFPF